MFEIRIKINCRLTPVTVRAKMADWAHNRVEFGSGLAWQNARIRCGEGEVIIAGRSSLPGNDTAAAKNSLASFLRKELAVL